MQLSSLQTQIRVSNQTLFNVFFIRSHCMVYHVTERRRTFLSPVCDGLLWSPACCSSAEAEVQAWEMCWGERFGEAGLPAPPWADPAPRLHLSGFRFWKRETRWALSGAAAVLTGPNLTSAFELLLVSSGSWYNSQYLREAQVNLLAEDVCRREDYYGNMVTDNMICASSPNWSQDACKVSANTWASFSCHAGFNAARLPHRVTPEARWCVRPQTGSFCLELSAGATAAHKSSDREFTPESAITTHG